MSNYRAKQTYAVNKFQLELYPYVAEPENRFEDGIALQYGADFKVRFSRLGEHDAKLGLVQLIWPQTRIFPTTVVHAWNVDKRDPAVSTITMGQCLYGSDDVLIGAHSDYYQGQHVRNLGEGECWSIDTPREINAHFADGVFTGETHTLFASYVVELKTSHGVIFDQGIQWGYSVVQKQSDPAHFDFNVQEPSEVFLSAEYQHRVAMANFLGSTEKIVKGWIS